MPTPTQRLFRHSAGYMAGQGAFFLSRLIFYIAFTRLFDPADYGTLNLISSALLFFIVAVRLGQNDSIVRLLPDGKKSGKAPCYVASIVLPMLGFGLAATALLFGAVAGVAALRPLPPDLRWAFYFACPIVGLRLGADLTYAILRALERPVPAVILDAGRNWLTIAASLAMVFAWQASMAPFFLGQLAGEFVVFFLCLRFLARQFSLRPAEFDRGVWRQALAYGLPMVVYHLSAVALLYVDRYIVLGYFGPGAVGQYSAGYNLAAMVQQIFALPVTLAVVPLYMNLWSRGEPESARMFVESTLRWFWAGAWPCIFGVAAIKSDLILLLATEKYQESSPVVTYVLAGYIVYGAYPIYAAGLLIHKKTGALCLWMLAALAVNVGVNLLLVPRFHIVGAAAATTVAYVFFALAVALASRRYLAVRLWPPQATRYLVGALAMYLAVRAIALPHPALSLTARLAAGTAFYGVWLYLTDSDVRQQAVRVLRRPRP